MWRSSASSPSDRGELSHPCGWRPPKAPVGEALHSCGRCGKRQPGHSRLHCRQRGEGKKRGQSQEDEGRAGPRQEGSCTSCKEKATAEQPAWKRFTRRSRTCLPRPSQSIATSLARRRIECGPGSTFLSATTTPRSPGSGTGSYWPPRPPALRGQQGVEHRLDCCQKRVPRGPSGPTPVGERTPGRARSPFARRRPDRDGRISDLPPEPGERCRRASPAADPHLGGRSTGSRVCEEPPPTSGYRSAVGRAPRDRGATERRHGRGNPVPRWCRRGCVHRR